MSGTYIDPTRAQGAALFSRPIAGPVVMLNLLRFREIADYSKYPDLAPPEPISGREAYRRYMTHTAPFLEASGGEVVFAGQGGAFFIGPEDEAWDFVLLVRQPSLQAFLRFATDEAYQAGLGHRTAALLDSRLLPMIERGDVGASD